MCLEHEPTSDHYNLPKRMNWRALEITSMSIQGYLAHMNTPTPLGPPEDPRHRPTIESWRGAFPHGRGAPVWGVSISLDTLKCVDANHTSAFILHESDPLLGGSTPKQPNILSLHK